MGEDAARFAMCRAADRLGAQPMEVPLAQEIRIEFTRFSAFYSPPIATM